MYITFITFINISRRLHLDFSNFFKSSDLLKKLLPNLAVVTAINHLAGMEMLEEHHCVKSVRIRSYSGPHFPAFGPVFSLHSVFSPKGKMWTRITPNIEIFTQCKFLTFY